MGKTIIEMDPKYAYISCGVDKKDKKAIMDDFRIRHAIDWLKQNRTTFLDDGECDGEWSFPTSGNGEKGGFGTVFTVSNTNNKTYAIKLASLVQLLDLGNCEIDDDKQALIFARYMILSLFHMEKEFLMLRNIVAVILAYNQITLFA